jgi:hypothetical protein
MMRRRRLFVGVLRWRQSGITNEYRRLVAVQIVSVAIAGLLGLDGLDGSGTMSIQQHLYAEQFHLLFHIPD